MTACSMPAPLERLFLCTCALSTTAGRSVFDLSVSGWPEASKAEGGREKTKTRKQRGAGAQPSESVPVEEKIRNIDHKFLKVGSRTKILRMVL